MSINVENKTPQEIQQLIYVEIKNGADKEELKSFLQKQGIATEGYYFTTEEERNAILTQPKVSDSGVTTKQILLGILTLVVVIIRIARCSRNM
jgi:hypothetical protein